MDKDLNKNNNDTSMDVVISEETINNKKSKYVNESNNKYLIKFRKPYYFEGKEYNGIDLSGIDNLTTSDLADADKIFVSSGNLAAMNEMAIGYSCIIAAKITMQPIEFFENLPAKEGVKLKNIISSFFYEED
ncbi:MAG: phage tail assembly protein [Vallitalea sp.]|jgi:ADP-ribosylglycohydrolase|nr:phage tail assembly protein [Vallitalea sp.]